MGFSDVLLDGTAAFILVAQTSWRRNLTAWVYVPSGILLILLLCFGVNSLIALSSISFPASVMCMLLLFFGLMLCELVIGDRRTREIVSIIDIPTGFALRYINLFFTPSFVLLPLSNPIGGIEVAKVIGIFGFLLMMAVTAYMVRGLQLLLGSSKRALTERAEELGHEDDAIPLTDVYHGRQTSQTETTAVSSVASSTMNSTIDLPGGVHAPPATQDPDQIRGTGGPPVNNIVSQKDRPITTLRQSPIPLTRAQRWAALANANFDRITYGILFVFVGIPVYYSTGYAMPAQLTLNIIAYFLALSLPPKWKQFLHPVLLSSAITVLGIWILGLIRRDALTTILHAYKTNTKYTQLWHPHATTPSPLPGAGDIFSSILDASIVALALPMFQYRKELRAHFLAIVLPNIAISVASLFAYPALASALGISPTRALSFAVRSLTLALATPAAANLGGDLNTAAALAIASGILGVLVGGRILRLLRIPEDDYVTRGVTLGGNSSAIATALLLMQDPRAAALASLSMSLFGTIMVALTSVPPVVRAVRGLVGLE